MNVIGSVRLANKLILAPMANILDLPLRLTFKDCGFGLTSIGSISAEAIVERGKDILINLSGKEEFTDIRESPVMIQLIGSDEYKMAKAAELIAKKADIIDLNFGCPDKCVVRKGWGAALLENISAMQSIIKTIVKSVDIPVTAKIRLVPSKNFIKTLDIARFCQDAGISALIVHTRTPQEGFKGKAHWEILPKIKKAINIPIVGNGNVCNLNDVRVLLEEFNCDFVMVGTGALRNPLAFIGNEYRGRKIALWDFAQHYARHRGNQLFNIPSSLAKFMLIRLRVNNFVMHHC